MATKDDFTIFTNTTLPLQVANLPSLNIETVENFERYKEFVDKINDLIKILNSKNDLFNIPYFNSLTEKSYDKLSRSITEYGPLIKTYNEVIYSARTYKNKPDKETLKVFYVSSGKFALETGLIVGAVFYSSSYEATGIAYRSLGLNKYAFECPECISVILTNAHWVIRNVLVEGTSKGAEVVLEKIGDLVNGDISVNLPEDVVNKTNFMKSEITGFLNNDRP